ncbi:MAG: tRNA adenosine(34) deaminase TadA [Lachnospiraceae bacterium]|nr:tRNA adenosine(34) deaminase TadA [Lachnospiraceae bacterium]
MAEKKEIKTREKYMKMALKEAEKAAKANEVPIGCVIVHNGKVIAKDHNRRNKDKSVLSHAEILCIGEACKKIKDWRLEECTMYVTLEPCQMCAGAIVQARVPEVVIGTMNPKAGCAGSVINILQMPQFTHQVDVTTGVLEEECSALISKFFADLRDEKRQFREEAEAEINGGVSKEKDTEDQE